jgi:hypothetical protein
MSIDAVINWSYKILFFNVLRAQNRCILFRFYNNSKSSFLFSSFSPSEFESGISFFQRNLVAGISELMTLLVPNCTVRREF